MYVCMFEEITVFIYLSVLSLGPHPDLCDSLSTHVRRLTKFFNVLQGGPRPSYPGGPQIGGPLVGGGGQMGGGRMGLVQPGGGAGIPPQPMTALPPGHSYPGMTFVIIG